MALTDSLRILITANGAQAEREFSRVGAAARTNLGHAETSAQRFGRSLTSAGVAMAVFGGVALVGLYKAAQAAEEEDLAIAKLNNSLANSPELAGATADAFLEQAAALQDVTTFTDDATISAQAMLGTFHLTQDEILGLTPLVQDLAAKFDIDLNRAAILAGKAMDGNSGALGRMGVNIDEAAFATDRFGAVMSALRENAGGFAEQEGATFNGQMTIMKNNLGDIAEGIGRGAVQAFNTLLGPVKAVSKAFEDLNPETQKSIGKVATFGAAGLVAGGSVSFLAGQILTAVTRFKELRAAMTAARLGTLGAVGGVAALAAGIAILGDHLSTPSQVDNFVTDLTESGADITLIAGQIANLNTEVQNYGRAGALAHVTTSELESIVSALAEVDPRNAQLLTDELIRQGVSAEVVGAAIDDVFGGMEEMAHASRLASLGLEADATSAEEAAAAFGQLNDQIDAYLGRIQGVEEANVAEAEAQHELNSALYLGAGNFDLNTEAGRTNIGLRNAWVDSVAGQIRATMEHAHATGNYEQAQRQANQQIQSAIGDLREMRDSGRITQQQFQTLSDQIRRVPHNVPVDIHTNVRDVMVQVSGLQNSLWELERTYSIPISIVNPDYLPGRSSGRSSTGRSSNGRSSNRSGESVEEFARAVGRELRKGVPVVVMS